MKRSRRKEVIHHLDEDEIDELLREAEDEHRLRRLGFLKNLYRGDSIPEAANREGRSAPTGGRWVEAWNEGGLEGLMPSFGGGRPPKLDQREQQELVEMLREDQPWKSHEIQDLLAEEFDVSYSPNYLGVFLRELGLTYVKRQSQHPNRAQTSEETPQEHANSEKRDKHEKGWVVDDELRTDGGEVVDFF